MIEDFSALLDTIAHDPDAARANAAVHAAAEQSGAKHRWAHNEIALPEALQPMELKLAEAMARRDDLSVAPPGVPRTGRLRRRWLGIDPPSVLERRVPWAREGREHSWPIWKVWREAPLSQLEHNQGIAEPLVTLLTPAERIKAAAEAALEPYGIGYPGGPRLASAMEHADTALAWAQGFVEVLLALRGPDRWKNPPGYGIVQWDLLGGLALTPMVRAGVALEPRWDAVAPYPNREVLAALPPERREAVIFHRASTDWGLLVMNGLDELLQVLDLAPSERVARIAVGKLRNPLNRGFFKKRGASYRARLDALARTEPGVAEALKVRRAKKS